MQRYYFKIILFVCCWIFVIDTNAAELSWSSEGSLVSGSISIGTNDLVFNKSFTIDEGQTLTVDCRWAYLPNDVTITVNGSLIINGTICVRNGDAYIKGAGNIEINSGRAIDIRMFGDLHVENVEFNSIITESSSGVRTLFLKNVSVSENLDNGYYRYSEYQPILQIEEGSRVFVKGNLTNYGTINCDGRLVVGTETEGSDGTTVISSNGTLTNYGTINITTSDEALAKTQKEPVLENSVYYAAVTCADLINGRNSVVYAPSANGVITMSDGSLIVQNDVTLNCASKLLFNDGTSSSYIDVWGNLTQTDAYYNRTGEEAIVKLNGSSARAQINVRESYNDMTTLDNARTTHDWDLDNNQFTIDDRIELSVGSYKTASSEKLDEGVVDYTSITKDVYATEYSYVEDEIADYNDLIESLNNDKASLTNGDGYQNLLDLCEGDEEKARASAAERIAAIDEELALYQNNVDALNTIKLFADENITSEQLATLNTWFFNTEYGQWFINQRNDYGWRIEIRSGRRYYTYYEYFYEQYRNHGINHLKLYHYILAYMDAYGNDAIYYDAHHSALSVMLPIELLYFEVEQEDDNVLFEWVTESERHNDFFTVEYSLDGNSFYSLVDVDGAGNSTEQRRYTTSVSSDACSGLVYFRLRQTDLDGTSSYSEVQVFHVEGSDEDWTVYPNPATTAITISGGEYNSVYFVDMYGKKIPAVMVGEHRYSVEHLPYGMYYAVITTLNGPVLKEFLVTNSFPVAD